MGSNLEGGLRTKTSGMQRLACWIFFFSFSLLASIAKGQVTNGVITGIVTDPAGAAVSKATVTVRNVATNATRVVSADENGIFRVTELLPARYELKFEAPGFKAALIRDVILTVAETKRVDVGLQLGAVAETVEVTTAVREVNTEVASLSGITTEREILDLPLNGRDVYQLILTNAGTLSTAQSELQTTTPAVNGQRPRGNNFMLDGVSNNFDFLTGEPVITPNATRCKSSAFSPTTSRRNTGATPGR